MTVAERTSTIELHDYVELVRRVDDAAAGTRGTVIDISPRGDEYAVELPSKKGLRIIYCAAVDLRILETYA